MTPFSIARDASISARSRAAARPAALPALLCKRRSNAASGGSPPRHSPLSFRLSGGAQSGQNILPTPGPSVRGRKKMRVHIKGVCTGQRQIWQLCAQSPDASGSEQTPQPTHDVCVSPCMNLVAAVGHAPPRCWLLHASWLWVLHASGIWALHASGLGDPRQVLSCGLCSSWAE